MQSDDPTLDAAAIADCPSDADISAFVEGAMLDAQAEQLRRHLCSCATCAELVSELTRSLRDEAHDVEPPSEDLGLSLVMPGVVLNDRYVYRRVLGRGGMGVVVAAWDQQLSREVAIKCLIGASAMASERRKRFEREALALATTAGPQVVSIFDAGMCRRHAFPFLVMELLHGEDLAARLRRGPALKPEEAVDLARSIASALAHAHDRGIVHRDLKPANIFLEEIGEGQNVVKLLDFGISKVWTPDESAQGAGLTQSHALVGTAAYIAPEQIRAPSSVGPPADIWSLGVVLYEILYGRVPFAGQSLGETLATTLNAPLQFPRDARVPAQLQALLSRMLAKDPDRRIGSASAFQRALDGLTLDAHGAGARGRYVVFAASTLALTAFALWLRRPMQPVVNDVRPVPPPPSSALSFIEPSHTADGADAGVSVTTLASSKAAIVAKPQTVPAVQRPPAIDAGTSINPEFGERR